MSTDSDESPKTRATRKLADRAPAENIEASFESQLGQPSSLWDALQVGFAQVLASSEIKQSPGSGQGNTLDLPEPQSLGERSAPSSSAAVDRSYNEEFQRLIEKADARLMQLTPLERMNRRYPNMKLHSLPETFPFRDLLGEPDVEVCLQYYQRFMAASESKGDEPVSILLEFLKEHSIEFGCSGWILYAVGYIVLGYPTPRHCERRARKLFAHYWRDTKSPKHKKAVQQAYWMFKGCRQLDSPHAAHWRSLVKWMDKATERGLVGTKWFDEYATSRPNRCACLNERNLQALRKAYVKVARRYEGNPPASAVVLEAVAAGHKVSSRALAEFRADARKKTRNSQ